METQAQIEVFTNTIQEYKNIHLKVTNNVHLICLRALGLNGSVLIQGNRDFRSQFDLITKFAFSLFFLIVGICVFSKTVKIENFVCFKIV